MSKSDACCCSCAQVLLRALLLQIQFSPINGINCGEYLGLGGLCPPSLRFCVEKVLMYNLQVPLLSINRARGTCWARISVLASDRARLSEMSALLICANAMDDQKYHATEHVKLRLKMKCCRALTSYKYKINSAGLAISGWGPDRLMVPPPSMAA